VLRGGSWNSYSGLCRASYRDVSDPGTGNDVDFGFRVARTP